jgi:hypothetical protein
MILAAERPYNSTQDFSPGNHPTKTGRPEAERGVKAHAAIRMAKPGKSS